MLLRNSNPHNLQAMMGIGEKPGTILIGDYVISMEDFCLLVEYALTNTDLEPNDPRLKLVESIKEMVFVPGFNYFETRAKRLAKNSFFSVAAT